MTIRIERELAAGMRDRVAGLVPDPDILAVVGRRHRRATVVRRVTYSAAALGVVGALAVGATTVGGPPSTRQANPDLVTTSATVTTSPASIGSPRLRLAAVAAANAAVSFRILITARVKGESKESSAEGAFDPSSSTGYMIHHAKSNGIEERIINGVSYRRLGEGPFRRSIGRHNHFIVSFPLLAPLSLYPTADSMALLEALSHERAEVSATGPDGFHFVLRFQRHCCDGRYVPIVVEGDIGLNADEHIATVRYDLPIPVLRGDKIAFIHVLVKARLYDYGAPVTVDPPPLVRGAR
jgi:hypothetical protein